MDANQAFRIARTFIESADRATRVDELALDFGQLVHSLGFQEYLAVSLVSPDHWPTGAIQLNGYSPAWGERYISERYFEVDPFFTKAKQDTLPFVWHRVRESMTLSDRQQALMSDAAAANHEFGMTVPVPAAAGESYQSSVSVCADRHDLTEPVCHAVHLAAMYLIAAAKRMSHREWNSVLPPVVDAPVIAVPTVREGDVLLWLARGKTAGEVSEILEISERTVRFHIANSKRKFGVATTMQAVVHALVNRHISA